MLANKVWPVLLFHEPHGMLYMFQGLGFVLGLPAPELNADALQESWD
jgi:hypothetical protein